MGLNHCTKCVSSLECCGPYSRMGTARMKQGKEIAHNSERRQMRTHQDGRALLRPKVPSNRWGLFSRALECATSYGTTRQAVLSLQGQLHLLPAIGVPSPTLSPYLPAPPLPLPTLSCSHMRYLRAPPNTPGLPSCPVCYPPSIVKSSCV